MGEASVTTGVDSEMRPCPCCGTEAFHHLKLPHTEVLKCSRADCGLQFASEQLNEEDLSQAYRDVYYPSDGKASTLQFPSTPNDMLRQVFSQLRTRIGEIEGGRLLDYGCGVGNLLAVAREFGFEAEGIEQDPAANQEATNKLGKRTYRNVGELLSLSSAGVFDLVILWNVIEHLREPWSDLRQLRSLLRPGGWLLVSTPNVNSVRGRLQRSGWQQYADPTHFYYFERRSLERVIRSAGFGSIEEWKPRLRHSHHGTLRHLFFRFSYHLGISGGVFYLSRADRSPTNESLPDKSAA